MLKKGDHMETIFAVIKGLMLVGVLTLSLYGIKAEWDEKWAKYF